MNRQGTTQFKIRRTEDVHDADWLHLRCSFWDGESEEEHLRSLQKFTISHAPYFAFIANDEAGKPLGFAEISLRRDYVNSCESSPVLFLEGVYVLPQFRGLGIAAALCRAAEEWARERGIREFASDVDVGNTASIQTHLRLGFEEMERVVCFRKVIQ